MAKNELPVDKINKLAEILKDQDLTEIELESGDFKIKVRKEVTVSSAVAAIPAPAMTNGSAPATNGSAPAAPTENFIEVKSPMVGTFYAAPSPGADPFVKVGDKIKKGDTVCIVEAMKLMNELPSEVEGEIVEICVSDGEAISYGQVIAKLK